MNRANRPRMSRISGSSRASKLMTRAGDGSTLSLDFTTGVLDPRLTFTRSTNATFINSQGLVQYAFSNRIPNSASLSGFNVTGVTATADATEPGPVVAPSGTQATKVTTNGGATAVSYNRNFGTGAGTATGMTYSIYIKPSSLNNGSGFRYAIRNETTSLNTYGVDVVWANSPVTINEVIGAADGDYEFIGPDARGWYRLILKVTNTSLIRPGDNLTVYAGYSGQGTGFFDTSGSYWVWGAQLEPGLTASPIYLTDSTSTGYFNTPRFDYDPTTLTPRGLLFEGSASNLVKYSQDLNQVSGVNQWYGAAFNTPTVPGSPPTDPFGGTTSSWKLVATAGSAYHVWRFAATYTAADYTFSFWARAAEYDRIVLSDVGSGRGGCRFVLTGNGTATVIAGGVTPTNPRITPYPGGWYRCEVTMTMTAALYGIGIAGYPSATTPDAFGASYNADGTSGVFATAVQAELGSGASSYIPTGSSTGNRAADICYITNADYGFTTTGGTYFVEWDRGQYDNPNVAGADCFAFSTDYASGRWLAVFTAPAGTTTSAGSWSVAINQASTAVAGRNRAAVSYAGWNATTTVTLSANGSSPTSNASMTLGTTPTYLMIGAASQTAPYNGSGLRDILGNTVRRLKYWPFVLPSTTMQSITVNT